MVKALRRRDIERSMRAVGCWVKSTTGNHAKWICPCGKHSANIPGHATISPGVVASTLKRLACLPEGWLK
jgi:hypothetical protein